LGGILSRLMFGLDAAIAVGNKVAVALGFEALEFSAALGLENIVLGVLVVLAVDISALSVAFVANDFEPARLGICDDKISAFFSDENAGGLDGGFSFFRAPEFPESFFGSAGNFDYDKASLKAGVGCAFEGFAGFSAVVVARDFVPQNAVGTFFDGVNFADEVAEFVGFAGNGEGLLEVFHHTPLSHIRDTLSNAIVKYFHKPVDTVSHL
jgi:hypothetical protein